MTDIKWSYNDMYKWYTQRWGRNSFLTTNSGCALGLGMQKWNFAPNPVYTKQDVINEETKDIIAIVYESKKPSKNTQNKLEPFIRSNIKYVGISPVQDKETIKEDIFLVYDDNSSNKQWLYFVFPTLVKCLPGTQSFLSANHFTFCYDKSDKKKPCHFHSTYYLCVDKLCKSW